MLAQLHIENVAVIENADLVLADGLNVLTGETGAGKSILIGSINLALGERVSREIVRAGAHAAHVTALFAQVPERIRTRVEGLGFPCEEDGSLLLSREITADGRGSCRISGRPATVSVLREVGRLLVNIHGQHDNQALLAPENHIRYLDLYAGNTESLQAYHEVYQQLRRLRAQLKKLAMDDAEKARRVDLLRYQIDEIRTAGLRPGEEEELEERRSNILHAEKITGSLQEALGALQGAETAAGADTLAGAAASAVQAASDLLPQLVPLAERLQNLRYELEDCAAELQNRLDGVDADPRGLEAVEERLDTIFRLRGKYGETIGDILTFAERSEQELESITSSGERADALRQKGKALAAQAKQMAGRLTENRRRAARTMEEKIRTELAFLEMPNVRFHVKLTPLSRLEADGADGVEFLFAANPGAPLRPLVRIASGGEISRVMLAIKNALADVDDIDTLIFDEIDTGVSGRAAYKIGVKLKQVAGARQIVCITHLAQIAAQADRHVLIEKTVEDGRTFTRLHVLDFEGRKRELARIIGGAAITPLTLQNAAEMLGAAGTFPSSDG
ncbi:DNA repair protein RecN [Ethanoligenens harbinense]|uniref:DNA repair protein RecN n=1 Tax=Ethanoligenens harbinense (strain DSM 18485 / JCM 12961 / CGMCC 1.5033 / YUAN-3) TaxID=663278 RepID=E6U5L0_ETHHY|nr:DNA repair protein RecN [Ethanoligenens harbinense]ADU26769.1 DNA repair protein RecN [Ethanoligenens harbinense YUAN-3]AVQ95875.1 DNA repair protein RecN [Ethanoligenens harbinense YUAN-3]AYF38537.1 DNA repair protein RecN [Ethanoligenens harbinense]AYF41284.1 DNA repair protein RecN [Ethanoligenens harbinense]QCN92116.1 DNA repair protein RecN [Ethanoligenens harbinense]